MSSAAKSTPTATEEPAKEEGEEGSQPYENQQIITDKPAFHHIK